jgi:outer membrane protein W
MESTLRRAVGLLGAGFLVLGAVFPRPGAASDFYGAFTYQMSLPMGTTQDYIESGSFRGAGLDIHLMQSPRVSVGALLAWNVFHEETDRAITFDGSRGSPGAIGGAQNRYLNVFPMMASVHYYLGEAGKSARPFVGLGAGGFVVKQALDMGLSSIEETSWEWGVAPVAGVVLPIRPQTGILLNVRYNQAFTGEERLGEDFKLSYWSMNAGITWRGE